MPKRFEKQNNNQYSYSPFLHDTGPSITQWSGLTSGIQCASSPAVPPCSGGGGGRRCERLSAHIFISADTAVAAKGGRKRNSPAPAHEAAALTNTSTRAGFFRPRAQTFVNQMFTCRCCEIDGGESQRRLACLFAFPSLSVCTSPSVTGAIYLFLFFPPSSTWRCHRAWRFWNSLPRHAAGSNY